MQKELERLQRLGADLERMIDVQDLMGAKTQSQSKLNLEFDALELDQYNELHSIGRMLVETATDTRQIGSIVTGQLSKLDHTLLTQGRLHRETQEKVLSARMVPIKTIVSRLQRGVRQTCRLTEKQVELTVQGDETLVDSEVLNGLVEPLMHILRNAVDHGVETEERRVATGKQSQGAIQLDFLREGNHLLVRCQDDGAGLDFAAIRKTGEAKGMLQPGRSLTEEELANLVLQPGFSTRTEVTQTSGRGMGLDVVYAHVLSRGGNLSLRSKPGLGTTTEIQLPVSLISTHAVLARIREQVMAIADRGVEQILHGVDGTVRVLGENTVFQIEQRIYPLRDLDNLLRLPPDRRQENRSSPPVLLVRGRSGLTAVRVEAVLSGIDLVVKDLGQYMPHLPGIIGATILGDGTVTPVLDLPELIANATGSINLAAIASSDIQTKKRHDSKSAPIVLVVDDSLSARRALVQVMEDAGYRVRSARDGLEAVTIVAEQKPDMVLADMEMPRMNGIELTAHLRAHPATSNLPVIMITSRSTAKHRQQAASAGVNVYLTKPFSEDELLEQVAVLRRSS
jgi:chemosensory pili system protein ChpA (sensor histidine kinase/response regulator)